MEKISSNDGLANKRVKISFSNFPLELDEDYFAVSYITDKILSFNFGDINLQYDEDVNVDGVRNIIPKDVYEYSFEDNAINMSIGLDVFKRNYFMFFDLARSHMKKNKMYQGQKKKEPIKSLEDLKIDRINIDLCDNVGNAKTLLSIVLRNCFLNNLDALELDIKDTNQDFRVGFLYEDLDIDYDRMQLLARLENPDDV